MKLNLIAALLFTLASSSCLMKSGQFSNMNEHTDSLEVLKDSNACDRTVSNTSTGPKWPPLKVVNELHVRDTSFSFIKEKEVEKIWKKPPLDKSKWKTTYQLFDTIYRLYPIARIDFDSTSILFVELHTGRFPFVIQNAYAVSYINDTPIDSVKVFTNKKIGNKDCKSIQFQWELDKGQILRRRCDDIYQFDTTFVHVDMGHFIVTSK